MHRLTLTILLGLVAFSSALGDEAGKAPPVGDHWAFRAPERSPLPAVKNAQWPRNGIDRFVLARIEAAGLRPSPAADRYTLIRRVSLDLTGLPPTPAEADAFVADASPQAYENLVDRLLTSPHFGERWAQMWLDLARYADTMGYEKDLRRDIWRYRDWVIEALNADMPYDRFTTEQLAGDLLPDASESQLIATAFHRNTLTNQEGGTDDEEFRIAAVKDRVDTTMQVWMGLTIGCAKCHSHKYDPISMRDYYSFFALFNQTTDADRGDDAPTLATPTAEQAEREADLVREAAKLRKERETLMATREFIEARDEWQKTRKQPEPAAEEDGRGRKAKQAPSLDELFADVYEPTAKLSGEMAKSQEALKQLREAITKTPVMRELAADKQRATHLHTRGNFLDPGEAVTAALPASFAPAAQDIPTRLTVAQWLTRRDNPLTARVAVNRLWARLFGTGLVETEEDFGTQGTPPSHPQLLDYLAVEFMDNGWSVKRLLKTIVMSATYQQSSAVTSQMLEADSANRLLARGPRFRLEAELVRDQALAAAGLLSHKIGGPSVMPHQPEGIWQVVYRGEKWEMSAGEDRYRRGLYTFIRRTSPYPSMLTFDGTSREVCTIRRVRTNTPLQALVTLNDPVYVEAAAALARRMIEGGASPEERAAHGFCLAVIRPPEVKERRRLVELYNSALAHFSQNAEAARQMVEPYGDLEDGVTAEQFAAWMSVANVLLNLDEMVTRG